MSDKIRELKELLEVLQLEKQKDFDQFKTKVQSLSLTDRKQEGYTWHPLEVLKSGYTYGERAFVIIQRAESNETPHLFRAGKTISFSCLQPNVNRPECNGVVNYVSRNKMKLILNTKDLPDWLNLGQLAVDLLFDERSYSEMEKAVKKVMAAKGDRLAELRNIFLGKIPRRIPDIKIPSQIAQLNPSQNAAVDQILETTDIAVIHGPPGTGKTTTLVQAIKLISKQENNILVTAPSNTAVDLLTERLAREGLAVVRIGNISRVDEHIIQYSLDAQIASHPESKNIKKIKIQAAECRRKARRFKRNFGHEEREERRSLHQEAKELANWASTMEKRLIDQILASAQVITATLVGTSHSVLQNIKFRTVVIDEAAQALEPATWIPISMASRVILAGDPFQLPPTVKSQEAKRGGLEITLIEKCLQRFKELSLLNIQYRMHEKIMGFSNQKFYENALNAAPEVANASIGNTAAIVFIDTAGCGFEEKVNKSFRSRYNPDEFNILREHFLQLTTYFSEGTKPGIAIISPYREQVVHISEAISEEDVFAKTPITVDTIDGFQGQEEDIVYISLVRSNSKGEIGFLKDYRRMNVAMTRAKRKLIIIGDSATIGNDTFYSDLLEYIEAEGLYQSAWEYMLSS